MFKLPGCHAKSALLVGVLATLFAGCGQNGPLYRSDESAQQTGQPNSTPAKRRKSPFSRIPAPQSQKHDQPQKDSSQTGDSSPAGTSDAPPAVDPDRPADPTPVPTP